MFRQSDSEKEMLFNLLRSDLDERLDFFQKSINCGLCKAAPIELITSCSHGFCENCFKMNIETTTRGLIIYSKYEASELTAPCPECSLSFTMQDLEKVFDNCESLQNDAKIREIQTEIDTNDMFTCMACTKIRGVSMLPKNSCYHMCKICIAQEITNSNQKACKVCNEKFEIQEFVKEKIKCSGCKKTFYIVGDNVQEICPGFVYCVMCTSKSIDLSICPCHNKEISRDLKKYLIGNIMKMCKVCNEENFNAHFWRHSCCKMTICYLCTSKSNYCQGCGNQLSLKHSEMVQKFIVEHKFLSD